jgi:hypothetical protein
VEAELEAETEVELKFVALPLPFSRYGLRCGLGGTAKPCAACMLGILGDFNALGVWDGLDTVNMLDILGMLGTLGTTSGIFGLPWTEFFLDRVLLGDGGCDGGCDDAPPLALVPMPVVGAVP